jgi:ketopantoate reductase
MALKKGTVVDRGYVTVATDEGVNYREIADTMSELGFPMYHSSARNYVLRVMRKFVAEFAGEYDIALSESKIDEIAKSPNFQHCVADLLHTVEYERRMKRDILTSRK